MLKEFKLSVAVLCLSFSFIISSLIIANGIKSKGEYISNGLYNLSDGIGRKVYAENIEETPNIDLSTAAAYLGITEENLMDLASAEDSGIPYIKVGGRYVFNKAALDKWLETAQVQVE